MASGLKLFDLKGKTALLTGSSQGIGYALANGLAEAGSDIILNGRNIKKLKQSVESINTKQMIFQLCFDATNYEQVRLSIDKFEKEIRPIDILINNAGMQFRTPLEDFPLEKFEELFKTNFSSVFNVSQVVAKHMIKRGEGKIINIASVQTSLARPGIAPYTASKGAVGNITKGMATDWAKYGIQCNAIAPGYFDTPLNAALVSDNEFTAWLKKRTPAGRWGEVHELVGAGIFLSSEASNFVNGHTLYVDGGITSSL